MSTIENGLRADIMRNRMEDKNTLNQQGGIYVGTGIVKKVGEEYVSETEQVFPSSVYEDLVLMTDPDNRDNDTGLKFAKVSRKNISDNIVTMDDVWTELKEEDELTEGHYLFLNYFVLDFYDGTDQKHTVHNKILVQDVFVPSNSNEVEWESDPMTIQFYREGDDGILDTVYCGSSSGNYSHLKIWGIIKNNHFLSYYLVNGTDVCPIRLDMYKFPLNTNKDFINNAQCTFDSKIHLGCRGTVRYKVYYKKIEDSVKNSFELPVCTSLENWNE